MKSVVVSEDFNEELNFPMVTQVVIRVNDS